MVMMIVFILNFVIYLLFYLLSFKMKSDLEASSPYECGFNINSLTRVGFSYRFFLISILFLIFDVEIALLLCVPYLMSGTHTLLVLGGFILILMTGLFYEMNYGALDWL